MGFVRAARTLCALLLLAAGIEAQEPGAPEREPAPVNEPSKFPAELAQEQTNLNADAGCLDPAPIITLEDYTGPFSRLTNRIGAKVDRKSVHTPHYKAGSVVCALAPWEKFKLFVTDSIDPLSFAASGANALYNQWTNQDPTFGQGMHGYVRRFGAEVAGDTAARLFGEFLYPTIFSQDPRYYRLGHGKVSTRLVHAVRHTVIAHSDNGGLMFNYTEWLGTASSLALNNLYHPGNQPGVRPAVINGAWSVGEDMGFDILREFWPEIARAFHMPFRGAKRTPANSSPE